MRAWRLAHGQGQPGSYMSQKAAEHRARRRDLVQGNRYGTIFGRNQLGSLFTKTFEHSCGVLRKSVEQRAEELYRSGDLSLDQCAEVHRRCQHKGDTALQKYVLRLQSMETDVPDDVSVAETLDLPPDAIDMSASDDEEEQAPPPLVRTGPTTAGIQERGVGCWSGSQHDVLSALSRLRCLNPLRSSATVQVLVPLGAC